MGRIGGASRRVRRVAALLVAVVLVGLAGWWIPTGQVVFAPGVTGNLADMVHVAGGHRVLNGRLLMVAITVMPADVWLYLWGKLNPNDEVLPQQLVFPGMSLNQYVQFNASLMDQSQQAAEVAGERLAGLPARAITEPGVVVAGLLAHSSALGRLKIGDRVVAVGGHPVTLSNLYQVMSRYHVGQVVPFTVRRGNRTRRVPLRLTTVPGDPAPGVGIVVAPAVRYVIPRPVQIQSGDIGGPSAGLMFALEIYQQITGRNLARGRTVAGTGEITPGGRVEQIGGVVQKVVTVYRAGASVFLCPVANYAKAEAAVRARGWHLAVLPVATLAQAVRDLTESSGARASVFRAG
jgi:PDZ domain-containing protein